MHTVAIIQARMGSTRLPGKVMKPLVGKPMLSLLLDRVKTAREVDQIVVATTVKSEDDAIVKLISSEEGVDLCRGPEKDVLTRFYKAATLCRADVVLRVTADNPLFDPETADKLIDMISAKCDYAANNLERRFPYGIDLEAFTFEALESAHRNANESVQREHVTPYIREHPEYFCLCNLKFNTDLSHIRLTVDTQEDYIKMKSIFEEFGPNVRFTEVVEDEV